MTTPKQTRSQAVQAHVNKVLAAGGVRTNLLLTTEDRAMWAELQKSWGVSRQAAIREAGRRALAAVRRKRSSNP